MEIGQIIGRNLKEYRIRKGYSQDHIAKFIGIDRSNISYYENAEREVPFVILDKLADLYAIELDDLLEEDSTFKIANMAFAFRAEGLQEEDLKSISEFHKVVKCYINMKKILSNER